MGGHERADAVRRQRPWCTTGVHFRSRKFGQLKVDLGLGRVERAEGGGEKGGRGALKIVLPRQAKGKTGWMAVAGQEPGAFAALSLKPECSHGVQSRIQ